MADEKDLMDQFGKLCLELEAAESNVERVKENLYKIAGEIKSVMGSKFAYGGKYYNVRTNKNKKTFLCESDRPFGSWLRKAGK